MSAYYVVALRDPRWYRDQVLTSASQASVRFWLQIVKLLALRFWVHLSTFVHSYAVHLFVNLQFTCEFIWVIFVPEVIHYIRLASRLTLLPRKASVPCWSNDVKSKMTSACYQRMVVTRPPAVHTNANILLRFHVPSTQKRCIFFDEKALQSGKIWKRNTSASCGRVEFTENANVWKRLVMWSQSQSTFI